MSKKGAIEQIIAKALAASRLNVDLEAALAWQKRPNEIARYLIHHIRNYGPQDRRLLYIKAAELTHDSMIALLLHGLQQEEDGPALKLKETMLMDKRTSPDVGRYLSTGIRCKSPLAEKIVQTLLSRSG